MPPIKFRFLSVYPSCNRYGIDPVGKLTIGSKICAELLGKLLSDLESMRIESLNTMAQEEHMSVVEGENDDIGRWVSRGRCCQGCDI